MKIIDISIPLNNDTVVYPNNAPVKIEQHAKLPEASSNLSNLHLGSHSGTHIDAPLHVFEGGMSLDKIKLSTFVGNCKVYDFSNLQPGECVRVRDFLKVNTMKIEKGDRILVKTSNSGRGFDEFYEDFVYLDGDCSDWLAEQEVALFGIDYLSVKKKGGEDNRPHTSLLENDIPIIEGLNLIEVKEGEYELYCLPLKFIGIEGGPARAILVDQS
jgi:arylformamidase